MRGRILLVGGDSGLVGVLREYLRVRYGDDYEVESIEYCDDALTTLVHRPFDLVLLLSLRVPWRAWESLSRPARRIGSESAIVFLKQLRALRHPVPIVLLSGFVSAELEAEALANGALAVIPKPVNLTELGSALDARLRPDDQDRPPRS